MLRVKGVLVWMTQLAVSLFLIAMCILVLGSLGAVVFRALAPPVQKTPVPGYTVE